MFGDIYIDPSDSIQAQRLNEDEGDTSGCHCGIAFGTELLRSKHGLIHIHIKWVYGISTYM